MYAATLEFDAILPDDLLLSSDAKQFSECNAQLKDAINKIPSLASRFDNAQLSQIMDGKTPRGYTWHHNEKVGIIQLVDTNIHNGTNHTGGRNLWGGGTNAR